MINRSHPHSPDSYPIPSKDSNYTDFKFYLNCFCTDFYFRDYIQALENLDKAKSLYTTLKPKESQLNHTFQFNCLMVDWILGKIPSGDIFKKATNEYTMLLQSYSSGIKERFNAVNSYPITVDSKFCTAVDNVINL